MLPLFTLKKKLYAKERVNKLCNQHNMCGIISIILFAVQYNYLYIKCILNN